MWRIKIWISLTDHHLFIPMSLFMTKYNDQAVVNKPRQHQHSSFYVYEPHEKTKHNRKEVKINNKKNKRKRRRRWRRREEEEEEKNDDYSLYKWIDHSSEPPNTLTITCMALTLVCKDKM